MKKELLSEEISQMKYLFGYKKGVVISEQEIEPKTSDILKSQNQDLEKQLSIEISKLSDLRRQNFKSIVDDKKENIQELIGKVKNFISNEKEDIKTFAQETLEMSRNIVNSIGEKVMEVKDKAGDKIEDIKIKRQIDRYNDLNQKLKEYEEKYNELQQTGKILTDSDKKEIKRNLLKLLLLIISAITAFMVIPNLSHILKSNLPGVLKTAINQ
jgi:hypothetical protein